MVAYANYFNDARIKNYVDALLRNGWEVDVFALGGVHSAQPGLRVVSLMSKVANDKALPYLLSQLAFLVYGVAVVTRAALTRRYSLVHVHNMPNFIIFTALFAKLFGARVVLDVHDTMPESYATKFDVPLSHPVIVLLRLEERLSAKFADLILTTNDLHVETLVGHGLPRSKIRIIMNVGNPALFAPRPARAFRADHGLVLGYHGTIAERLGLDLVVEAVHRALPSCEGLRLVLIGDGEFMPVVRRLVENYALQNVVSLNGWVPVEQLPRALAEVDTGVVGNRRRTEVHQNWMLPVKMLEYAAMEIPTIAPRLRAITQYFDDASALLYTADDIDDLTRVIKETYWDPACLDRVRMGLRTFNARYNWPSMETRYLELVRDLTGLGVA